MDSDSKSNDNSNVNFLRSTSSPSQYDSLNQESYLNFGDDPPYLDTNSTDDLFFQFDQIARTGQRLMRESPSNNEEEASSPRLNRSNEIEDETEATSQWEDERTSTTSIDFNERLLDYYHQLTNLEKKLGKEKNKILKQVRLEQLQQMNSFKASQLEEIRQTEQRMKTETYNIVDRRIQQHPILSQVPFTSMTDFENFLNSKIQTAIANAGSSLGSAPVQ